MSKFTLSTRNGSQTAETELRAVHLYDGKVTLVPKSDKVGSGRLDNYPAGMAFSYQRVDGALATNTTMSLKMNGKSVFQDAPIGFLIKDGAGKKQEISSELSRGILANAGFTSDPRGHRMTHFSLDVPYSLVGMKMEEMASTSIGDALHAVFAKHDEQKIGRRRFGRRKKKKKPGDSGDGDSGSSKKDGDSGGSDSSKKKDSGDSGSGGSDSGSSKKKSDSGGGGDSGGAGSSKGKSSTSGQGRKTADTASGGAAGGTASKKKSQGDDAKKDQGGDDGKKKEGGDDGGDAAKKKDGGDDGKKKEDGDDSADAAKKKEGGDDAKKKKEDGADDAKKKKEGDDDGADDAKKKKDDEDGDKDKDKDKKGLDGKGPEAGGAPSGPEAGGAGGAEAPQAGGGEGGGGAAPEVPPPMEQPGGGMGEGGAGGPPVVVVVEGGGGGEPSPTAFPVPVIYRDKDYDEDDDVSPDEFQDLFGSELKTDMVRAVLGDDHRSFRRALDMANQLDKKHIEAGIFDVSDRLADLRGQMYSFVMGKSSSK